MYRVFVVYILVLVSCSTSKTYEKEIAEYFQENKSKFDSYTPVEYSKPLKTTETGSEIAYNILHCYRSNLNGETLLFQQAFNFNEQDQIIEIEQPIVIEQIVRK